MNKLLKTLLAAGIAAVTFNVAAQTAAPAPAAPAAAPVEAKDIVDTAVAAGSFKTLPALKLLR